MEQKRGGKRVGAGRKPSGVEKKTISLYVAKGSIYKFGSEDKMKEKIYDFISGYGVQDLTKPTNEIRPFEQPKSNFSVQTQPQIIRRKTPQEWVLEKRAIADGDMETYQKWIRALDDDQYLTDRQKKEIKFA